MDLLFRSAVVIFLIAVGIFANLLVLVALWPLCFVKTNLSATGFSRAPAPVLDRLLGATSVAALLLAILTGVAQMPVLAYDWCPPNLWGFRGQCYGQKVETNFTWLDATVACESQGGKLAGFLLGRFPYALPNFEAGNFWVGVVDDGIPRPSCKNSAVKGKHPSPKCLQIDKGCPHMVIENMRNISVHISSCDSQAGYICDLGPMIVIPGFCQVQGLLTSFLSPLVLCYLTLISIERFMLYMDPEEHDLTFSYLNTNVIQVGIMFLLITDATGPVYGWAQYIFSSESGLCILDPGSRYVATYISVSLPLYYFLPLLVTVSSHVLLLLQRNSYREEDEYPVPSRVIPAGRRGQILLFFICVFPFLGCLPSVLSVVMCSSKLSYNENSNYEQDSDMIYFMCREGAWDFYIVWFKFFSISCLLPLFLLIGSPNLRKHLRSYFTHSTIQNIFKWRNSRDGLEYPIELSVWRKHSPDNEDQVIEID